MHLPSLTIVHYGGNQGSSVALGGQMAYAQRQYMRKHMSRGAEILGTGALALGYALRAVGGTPQARLQAGPRDRPRAPSGALSENLTQGTTV